MALGMGSSRVSSSELPIALIALVLVAGLVAGYAAGNFAPLSPQGQPGTDAGTGSGFTTKLSNDDRNFFVQVANAQVGLMAQQAATVDWCTAGGGLWLTQQRQGQVPVTAEQAQQLQRQGAQVVQQDGNFLATVVLFDRGSCVVVPTKGQAGQ